MGLSPTQISLRHVGNACSLCCSKHLFSVFFYCMFSRLWPKYGRTIDATELLNLALCYHQHKIAEHAESNALASGLCVFTKIEMVQRDLVAGKAGRAAWGPRICSDKVFKWQAFSDNSPFAYFTIKYYWDFKGTQPHNAFFFRDFELFYKALFQQNLSENSCFTYRLWLLARVLHLHVSVPVVFDQIDLHRLMCLPLIFHPAENVKTLRQCRLFSFCL